MMKLFYRIQDLVNAVHLSWMSRQSAVSQNALQMELNPKVSHIPKNTFYCIAVDLKLNLAAVFQDVRWCMRVTTFWCCAVKTSKKQGWWPWTDNWRRFEGSPYSLCWPREYRRWRMWSCRRSK